MGHLIISLIIILIFVIISAWFMYNKYPSYMSGLLLILFIGMCIFLEIGSHQGEDKNKMIVFLSIGISLFLVGIIWDSFNQLNINI